METSNDFYMPFVSFSPGPTASYGEMADAMHNQMLYVENVNAKQRSGIEAYDRYIDKVKGLTGTQLENPYTKHSVSDFGTKGTGTQAYEAARTKAFSFFEDERKRLTLQHPDLADKIQADRPMETFAQDIAKQTEKNMQQVFSRSRGGSRSFFAGLQGGLTGMLHDPLNVATMFIGGGAKTIFQSALRAGAINATIEGSMQPFVQNWRKQAGLKYGLSHAATNVAMAGVFGAGLDGGLRAAGKGLGLNKQNWYFHSPKDEDAALARTVPDLPADNPVKQLYEGTPENRRSILDMIGVQKDDTLRGVVHDVEAGLTHERLKTDGTVDRDHVSTMIASVAHALDPQNYPRPARAPVQIRKATEKPLEQAVPKNLKTGESFVWHGLSVSRGDFSPDMIEFDAQTFQFKKQGANGEGVTDRLLGIKKWSKIAANRIMVYERADGSFVIADGHQRLALAKRLIEQGHEKDINLEAFVFREKDGWTPDELYARAGQKNLQEGTGTVLDAARLIKHRADIIDDTIPLGADAMRQARNLALLSDDAMGMVINDVVPANYAAAVGEFIPDAGRHASVMAELAELSPNNIIEARAMLADINAMPTITQVQDTLFGELTQTRSLIKERAQVFGAAMKNLKGDKKVFGTLTREAQRIESGGNVLDKAQNLSEAQKAAQLEEMLGKLALTKGVVSDALNRMAARVGEGMSVKKAGDDFTAEIKDIFDKEGFAGLNNTSERQGAGQSKVSDEDLLQAETRLDEARLDLNNPEDKAVKTMLGRLFDDTKKAQRKVPVAKIAGEKQLAGPEDLMIDFQEAGRLETIAKNIEEGC